MSKEFDGIDDDDFCRLAQMSREAMRAEESRIKQHLWPNPRPHEAALHPYENALAFELARQLSDDGGISLPHAFVQVSYASAVEQFLSADRDSDQWMAVMESRNDWGRDQRESYPSFPATSFGPGEYWSKARFFGSFGDVMIKIGARIYQESMETPEPDPARIILANVSAADRRLRKRAAELGISLP